MCLEREEQVKQREECSVKLFFVRIFYVIFNICNDVIFSAKENNTFI